MEIEIMRDQANTWFWLGAAALAAIVLMGRRLVAPAVETMARAIMNFEGWHAGSRSERNNNPGNLKFAGQPGAIGQDDGGHAIFNSFESGWNALIRQLEAAFHGQSAVYSPEDSLYEFFAKYSEANSEPYAEFVAQALGVTPETTLRQILARQAEA
jgi:hypothetical protein